jgi:hypothetical protein
MAKTSDTFVVQETVEYTVVVPQDYQPTDAEISLARGLLTYQQARAMLYYLSLRTVDWRRLAFQVTERKVSG